MNILSGSASGKYLVEVRAGLTLQRGILPGRKEEEYLDWLSGAVYAFGKDGSILLATTDQATALFRPAKDEYMVLDQDSSPVALSPDGKWVLCQHDIKDGFELRLVPTDVGQARVIPSWQLGFKGQNPVLADGYFLPNGNRFLFAGVSQGEKRLQFVIYDADSNRAQPWVPQGSENALFSSSVAISRDGKRIALYEELSRSFRVHSLETGALLESVDPGVPADTIEIQPMNWTPDESGLVVIQMAKRGGLVRTLLVNLKGHTCKILKTLEPNLGFDARFHQFVCSEDGMSYAYTYQYRESSTLYLMTMGK